MNKTLVAAALAAILTSVTLTACGTTTNPEADKKGPCAPAVAGNPLVPPSAAAVTEDAKLAAEIPATYQGKTLKVGVAPDLPGVNFAYQGDQRGFEPDLLNAAAAKLGVKVAYTLTNDFISAFTSGQIQVGAGYLNDTKERQANGAQFANYLEATDAALVANCNPLGIKSNDDLCGKTVTAIKASTQLAAVDNGGAIAKACAGAGKPVPKALPAESTAAAITSVGTTVDAVLVDGPIAKAAVQSSPNKLSVGYTVTRPGQPTSLAFVDRTLAQPFVDALNALIADGTYKQILDSYGITEGLLTKSALNGATA